MLVGVSTICIVIVIIQAKPRVITVHTKCCLEKTSLKYAAGRNE